MRKIAKKYARINAGKQNYKFQKLNFDVSLPNL